MMTVETLGKVSADLMMRGAVEFLRSHGLERSCDLDLLVRELRAGASGAVSAALDEFRQAEGANMTDVGVVTFRMSMAIAGIDAARRACGL